METLLHFKNFLDELSKDNSRLYKMEVLKQYKDDEVVKYYLNYVYNPYIVTGISTKKLNKELEVDYTTDLPTFRDILEYAKIHNTGSDKDLSIIFTNRDTILENSLVENIEGYYNLFNNILIKNLQLGVEILSINKCIPNLIPTFDVQLANSYFDKPEYVEGKEFAITTKIDGSRIIAIKENNEVSFWTRQGQKYEGLIDLEKELKDKFDDFICLDGELTLLDKGNLTSKDQYKETMKLSRKDGIKHGLKMLVFDCMTSDQFKNQLCENDYNSRRAYLDSMFKDSNLKYFECLPVLYKGKDTSEITKWLDYNTEHGEEGVMINICDSPYDFKRTNNLLKCKKFKDTEVRIIGFEEGTNKLTGSLGAFICEYKNNTVKVGSGMLEDQRKEFWNNRDSLLGKYITVKYFEETVDSKTKLPSLRFPTFLRFREDMN